ncbi:hypothetical protein D3C84_971070 [compost metagenome]
MAFGEFVGHDILRRAGHQLLDDLELIVAHAIGGADAGGEVQQGQRLVVRDLASQLIAHAELGAQLRRHALGLADLLVAAPQDPLSRLQLGLRPFEDAVFHRAFDTDFGLCQAAGQQQRDQCA